MLAKLFANLKLEARIAIGVITAAKCRQSKADSVEQAEQSRLYRASRAKQTL